MRSCRRRSSLLLAALALAAAPAARAASDESVFGVMKTEMDRSLSRLRQDQFGPPYFLAYRLVEQKRYDVSAAWGALLSDSAEEWAIVFVEARYGDRTLDNTELGYQGWHGAAGRTPDVLRQNLWNLTDGAYKQAVSGYLEKKAKRAIELVQEKIDDFSVEQPAVTSIDQPGADLERAAATKLVERLSARFKRYPHIFDGRVSAEMRWSRRYLLTSEGTRLATAYEHVPHSLRVTAMTRAEDGMRLDNHRSWSMQRLKDLPSEKELEASIDAMARELELARQAPVQEPMAAPAILDPEFTGVVFHEAIGHKLEGQRQRDPRQSQVFKDLIGKRIIPEFLSLHDDPTLKVRDGVPVHGYYEFDAEGVRAQPVVLVSSGVLRSFLMSRWPVKGFPKSNGHGRAGAHLRPTGRMANLIVAAENKVPRPELTKKLLELVRRDKKPYGFLLVGAFGGENPNTRETAQTLEVRPRLIYRVDAATGEATLVRGVSMVGTPLVVLNKIVGAADDEFLANNFVCGAESGYVPVSQLAPSVLLSEVELQRLPEDRQRPPILPSPFHDR